MNPTDVGKIIDELGQRLGPAGRHVYDVLVRQAYVTGLIEIIGGILLIVAAIAWAVAMWLRRRQHQKQVNDYYHRDDDSAFYAIFVSVPCLAGGTILFLFGLSILLNPEYSAITDLLRAIP